MIGGLIPKINKKSRQQQIELTLIDISQMGKGLKENIIDWEQIGKNAVYAAKEALREKCPRCGK